MKQTKEDEARDAFFRNDEACESLVDEGRVSSGTMSLARKARPTAWKSVPFPAFGALGALGLVVSLSLDAKVRTLSVVVAFLSGLQFYSAILLGLREVRWVANLERSWADARNEAIRAWNERNEEQRRSAN